jgi:cation transport ATPase
MTCAACAARVQARLDKVTGVIVAGATGIDEVIGEALPATKARSLPDCRTTPVP